MPKNYFCFFVYFASIFISQAFGMQQQPKTTSKQEQQKSSIQRAIAQETKTWINTWFDKLQSNKSKSKQLELESRQLKNAISQLNQIGNIRQSLASIPGHIASIFLCHGLINRYLICTEMSLDQAYTTLVLNWKIFFKSTSPEELSNKYFSPINYFLKIILKNVHTYIHKKSLSTKNHTISTNDKAPIETLIKFIHEDLKTYKEERISNFLLKIDLWIKKFAHLKSLIERSKQTELQGIENQILTEKNLIQQKEAWQELLSAEEENYAETINLEDTQSQLSTQSSCISLNSSASTSFFCTTPESTAVCSFAPNIFNEFENDQQLKEIIDKLNEIEQALQNHQNLMPNQDYQEHFSSLNLAMNDIKEQIESLKQNKELDLEILQNNETKIESLQTIILELQNKINETSNQETESLARIEQTSSEKNEYLKRIEEQLASLKISCDNQKPPESRMRRLERSYVCILFISVLFSFLYIYALINNSQTNYYYPNCDYRYRGPRPT